MWRHKKQKMWRCNFPVFLVLDFAFGIAAGIAITRDDGTVSVNLFCIALECGGFISSAACLYASGIAFGFPDPLLFHMLSVGKTGAKRPHS